eukprot:1619858-Pleurochrysis_carterae.AAC.1
MSSGHQKSAGAAVACYQYRQLCAFGSIENDFKRYAADIMLGVATGCIPARNWLYMNLLILMVVPGWPKISELRHYTAQLRLGSRHQALGLKLP